ncbi:hypothetical protein B5E60_13395, partial [Alistipes sp. An116]
FPMTAGSRRSRDRPLFLSRLLFIRQQGNGPERNANLMPRGFFPEERPPQMEMLPGKKVVVFAPARFWRCYR